MKLLNRPIWRVPVVLIGLGITNRLLTFLLSFLWVRIQKAQGPNPETGAYEISSGAITVVLAVIAFVLFWAAGWKFIRGLTRKQIFLSATIMVVWHGILLALEQWTMATSNWDLYFAWVYRLWITVDGIGWASQLLFRIFGEVSVPVMLPSIFTPYLYILLGQSSASTQETDFAESEPT